MPVLVGRQWEAIIRDASLSTVCDLNGDAPDLKREPDSVVRQYRFHVSRLTREKLKRQHDDRIAQMHRLVIQRQTGYVASLKEARAAFGAGETIFRENRDRRLQLAEKAVASYPVQNQTHPVQFFDVASRKAFLSGPQSNRLTMQPNRTQIIARSLEELRAVKIASRIHTLGQTTHLEMKLMALGLPGNAWWIDTLADISGLKSLPHQKILDKNADPT
jgi:hypothetical protein